MALHDQELIALLTDLECDRVERKESASNSDRLCEAICAFANDMPGYGKPGVLFIGVSDNGTVLGRPVTDELPAFRLPPGSGKFPQGSRHLHLRHRTPARAAAT